MDVFKSNISGINFRFPSNGSSATQNAVRQHINISNSTQRSFPLYTPEQIREILYRFNLSFLLYPHKWVLISLYILIFVCGIVINLLLVYTIGRLRNPKSLHNRRMLMFRVICDLSLIWFGVPFTAYTAVYRDWQLGNTMCKLSTFTIYFIVALNNFLLVAICLNRTVAISQNAKSPTDPTTNAPARVKFLISAAVVCALIIALPIGVDIQEIKHPLLPHLAKSIAHYPELRDQHPRLCKDTWSRQGQLTYDILLIVTIYLIPLFVVCLSQHLVTVHLRQSQRLLLLMGHQNTVAWTRRRQRLTRLCVLMAVLFVLSWSPNHICNVLVKTFYVDNEVTQLLMDYSMCIAMSNAVTGPLLLIATCSVYWRFLKRFLLCSSNRDRVSGQSTSVRSSLVMYCPGSQACMLVNRMDGQQPKLEVAPHVMLSVTSDLENINLE